MGGDETEIERLMAELRDEDRCTRMAACRRLGEIGTAAAVSALASATHDPASGVRGTVAIVLAKSRAKKKAVPVLLELLKDADSKVRALAARSLGLLKEPTAVTPLRYALRSASRDEVEWIIRALRDIGDLSAADDIARFLSSPELDLRWTAAEALATLGDIRAAEWLRQLSDEPEIPISSRKRIPSLLRKLQKMRDKMHEKR